MLKDNIVIISTTAVRKEKVNPCDALINLFPFAWELKKKLCSHTWL